MDTKYHFVLFVLCFIFTTAFGQQGIVNTPNAKVRDCDGLDCKIIGHLEKGKKYAITGRGKSEYLDGYGEYAWLKIKLENRKEGYVFGGLIDIINKPNQEVDVKKTAYVKEEGVNVRTCANAKKCDVLFQLNKGTYCTVLSKTKELTTIKDLGQHPWSFITVDGKKGYIFGALLAFESNQLRIETTDVKAYEQANDKEHPLEILTKGKTYTIIAQSAKSELIRPYGRHYWYEIAEKGYAIGWVFGAYTSKAKTANVDCQCVDYVKNVLSITGPTKNAFEWSEVLEGNIAVKVNKEEVFLDFFEIKDTKNVKKNDIVIFDKQHRAVDPLYGHIGIVQSLKKIQTKHGKIRYEVEVEGSNHKVALKEYYDRKKCHNVSKKTYRVNKQVRFFRPFPR